MKSQEFSKVEHIKVLKSLGINPEVPQVNGYPASMRKEVDAAIISCSTNTASALFPLCLALLKVKVMTSLSQEKIGEAHFRKQAWVSQHCLAIEWLIASDMIRDGKPVFRTVELADEFVARCHGNLKRFQQEAEARKAARAARRAGLKPTETIQKSKKSLEERIEPIVKAARRDNLAFEQFADRVRMVWEKLDAIDKAALAASGIDSNLLESDGSIVKVDPEPKAEPKARKARKAVASTK